MTIMAAVAMALYTWVVVAITGFAVDILRAILEDRAARRADRIERAAKGGEDG